METPTATIETCAATLETRTPTAETTAATRRSTKSTVETPAATLETHPATMETPATSKKIPTAEYNLPENPRKPTNRKIGAKVSGQVRQARMEIEDRIRKEKRAKVIEAIRKPLICMPNAKRD